MYSFTPSSLHKGKDGLRRAGKGGEGKSWYLLGLGKKGEIRSERDSTHP